MNQDDIILIDEQDNQIGVGEKMKVHHEGTLHRAFSILVFNSKGDLMLQKRDSRKYHSGGLWTNTCCSHPRDGEELLDSAHRRLQEEMGFDCELSEQFSFIYQAQLGELIEHECDHVIFGKYENAPQPNPDEVEDWKWINMDELKKDVAENPNDYTFWFKIVLQRI